jgi:glycosyltransferase involved in cell wall biosynthesis
MTNAPDVQWSRTREVPTSSHELDSQALAVVIPTFNSARSLRACLASLQQQTTHPAEVVVVDDELTTDETREIALGMGADLILSPANMAESRNVGCRSIKSPLILSIDSDMVLSRQLIEKVLSTFRDERVDALTIREYGGGVGYWAKCRALDKAVVETTGRGRALRAFRRDLFERLGGFDPTLPGWDDWDFTLRAQKAGARLTHLASASLEHDEGHLSLRAAASRKYVYGRCMRSFLRKHGPRPTFVDLPIRVMQGLTVGLREDPAAVPGFVFLKATDAAAILLGQAARLRRPPIEPT